MPSSAATNDAYPETVLRVNGLTKTYRSGSRTLTVLNDVSLALRRGESCAIVGPSGSGKTTLLGLSAGLDRSTKGSVILCGQDLDDLDEDGRARLRNEHVGFVFQSFRLIPTLTALENVMVPAELRGDRDARSRATALLGKVGLGARTSHYPAELSGGEQQRVAIARAFVNNPTILFADEPTGELDTDTGRAIADLLFDLNRTAGTTLVLVTHDEELASRSTRVIRLRGGAVESDTQSEASHQDEASANVTTETSTPTGS
ncbi:MAG: ABC transporter ATP-binding protein [Rhodothermia bacterium]|nr:ABC transporter ATP-binding protein [Rhodothermia bacterium]